MVIDGRLGVLPGDAKEIPRRYLEEGDKAWRKKYHHSQDNHDGDDTPEDLKRFFGAFVKKKTHRALSITHDRHYYQVGMPAPSLDRYFKPQGIIFHVQ